MKETKDKFNFFESLTYNILISILAVIAVSIAMIDLLKNISSPALRAIDTAIYIIFLFDYFARLIISKKKLRFIGSNVLDLIAIIPFSSIFRIARLSKLFRLTKLSKILKFSRLLAFIARGVEKCRAFLNTNGFKYMLLISIIFVLLGAFGIYFAEGLTIKDSLWWSFVTATTVGYGDILPNTGIGRIIACILMICGIGLIGSLTSTITSFFLHESRKATYKDEMIEIIKSKLDDVENMSDDDVENIYATLKALLDENRRKQHENRF